MAIREHRDHTRPVKEALLHRGDTPGRIAQHSKGLHRREGLCSVKPDVLLRSETPVEEEPQVLPGILGPEGGIAHKRGKPQVNGQRRGVPGPCEVKYFGLVMRSLGRPIQDFRRFHQGSSPDYSNL